MIGLIALLEKNIAAAFVSIGIVAPCLWMAMDREVPYTRSSGEIIPHNPRQGDDVEVVWYVEPKKACPISGPNNVKRWIVNKKSGGVTQFLPFTGKIGGSKNEIDRKMVRQPLTIPNEIETGPALYHSEACFACNPTHKIKPVCVTLPDIEFEIRSKDDSR